MYYARTPKERLEAKARRELKALRRAATYTSPKKKKHKRLVHQPLEVGKSIQHIRNRTGGRSRKVRRGA